MNKFNQDIIKEKIKLANGQIIERTYRKLMDLGAGGFGNVSKVLRIQDNKIFALKEMNKQSLKKKNAILKVTAEIEIQKRLKHKRICELSTTFEDQQNVYILLEYFPGKDLTTYFHKENKIPMKTIKEIIQQIIEGVEYIHSKNIIHRDLKLSNILWDEQSIKIIDFGFAVKNQYPGSKRYTICGTPMYLAPEIVNFGLQKPNCYPGYGKQIDVWAVGVMCYRMIEGYYPFSCQTLQKCYTQICDGRVKFSGKTNRKIRDFIMNCLQLQASKRAKISQLKYHPFLSKIDNPQKSLIDSNMNSKNSLSTTWSEQDNEKLYIPIKTYRKKYITEKPEISLNNMTKAFSAKNLVGWKSHRNSVNTCRNQEEFAYLNWIKKGDISVYTLSNGYKGTYRKNEDLKLLYNNQDYIYFQVRNNKIQEIPSKNTTISQQVAIHMKALAKQLNQNGSKCQHYAKQTKKNLIHITKLYQTKDNYYFASFSNGCYQIIDLNTDESLLLNKKEQLIYEIKLKDSQPIHFSQKFTTNIKSAELYEKIRKIIRLVKNS